MKALCLLLPLMFSTQQQSLTVPYTGTTNSANLSQFDPNLGTLDAVEISIRCYGRFTRKAENTNPTNQGNVYFGPDDINISIGDQTDRAAHGTYSLHSDHPGYLLSAWDGNLDWAGPGGVTDEMVTSVETGQVCYYTEPTTLAYFTGTGTVPFNVDIVPDYFNSGTIDIYVSKLAVAGAQVYLTYHYH